MAADVHTWLHAVYVEMIVPEASNESLNCKVEMEAFVESQAQFNVVALKISKRSAECRSTYLY